MKLAKLFTNIKLVASKRSPLILTGLGIVGVAVTGYLSYRAGKKVEEITDVFDKRTESGNPPTTNEAVIEYARVIALPVVTGIISVACITGAHKILSKRIVALSSALSASINDYQALRTKVRDELVDESAERFLVPVDEDGHKVTNEETGEVSVYPTIDSNDYLHGFWYCKSDEYIKGDHDYNVQYITAVKNKIYSLLFQRGTILMNEVYDMFGIPRTKHGAVMGWRVSTLIETQTVWTWEKDSMMPVPQIYVSWSTPEYVYDDIDFVSTSGNRYAVL